MLAALLREVQRVCVGPSQAHHGSRDLTVCCFPIMTPPCPFSLLEADVVYRWRLPIDPPHAHLRRGQAWPRAQRHHVAMIAVSMPEENPSTC